MRTLLTLIITLTLGVGLSAQVTTGPGSIVQTGNNNTATIDGQATVTLTPEQQAEQKALATPQLTDAQKLVIANAVLTAENAQLRMQQAAMAYEQARQALQQLIASVTPQGYQLVNDPQQGLMFAKVPEKKEGGE